MQNSVKYLLMLILIAGLISIRLFENVLFYDPLLAFFKTDHSTSILPVLNRFEVTINVLLRYAANTILSLAILWLVFKNKEILKLSTILYITIGIVVLIVFYILLGVSEKGDHMLLFYVRRFLIQPLLLLILLPAFYFQKQ